ncbi:MAG TPA: HAMP domain-containing sensor histidine kinase [Candidatus Saccharimonadales bacterium]|nr:HAMP domain-containing sensor histidine kinase [Candidatus Saccharimonadales bacterium]
MSNRDDKTEKSRNLNDARNNITSSDSALKSSKLAPNQKKNNDYENVLEQHEVEETKVIQGNENIKQTIGKIFQDCNSDYALYIDKNGPSLKIETPQYRKILNELKNKNVKIRVISEITADNLETCKKFIDLYNVDLRHLKGLEGFFGIVDNKLYFTLLTLQGNTSVSELVYSNIESMVNQNIFLFETMWKKAIPAEQRIKEIKEMILPIETFLIDDPKEGLNYSIDFVNRVENGLSICTSIDNLKLLDRTKALLQAYVQLVSKQKKGIVKEGIRGLTYVDNNKKHMELVKKFLNIGFEIRHSDHLPPINFAISDKQFVGSLEKFIGQKMFERILHSTDPLYMKHFQFIFEELWKEGISAQDRIRQIETGIAPVTTKVIENPVQSKNLFLQLIEEAQDEVMVVFPSLNTIKRQSKIGLFNLLKLKNQQNFRIRILSPMIDTVKEILLLEYSQEGDNRIDNIAIREIPRQQEIRSTVIIVDKKQLLAIEVKDDTKETFEEAIGMVTYSTSRPTLLSYISSFETLWIQIEMFENVRIANEKLIEREELEREFINTAAHELRTPTQAILGYTELNLEILDDILKTAKLSQDETLKINVMHLHKYLDAVSKNSERLSELINNLLDVARIESNRIDNLQLHKEKIDLVKEIKKSINVEFGQKLKDKEIKIKFVVNSFDEQCWVYADTARLNQIINNLIDNAIKFSNKTGKIDIIIEGNTYLSTGKKRENYADYNEIKEKITKMRDGEKPRKAEVFVAISDTGKGISPQIMPRLFEKFITDSDAGTGLGLYITRNLVEAHGGRIWAFNNKDGVGSTFVFSLPQANNRILDSTLQ